MLTKQSKQRSFPRLVCSCLGGGGGSGGSGDRGGGGGGGIKDGEGGDDSLILDLSHTRLHTVPPQVYTPASAQSLQEIHLDGNYIQDLPKELCALPLLRVLSVADNDLASLPPAIGGLAGLRRIDASRNELRDIPDNIRSCRQLSVVNVSNNTLSRLPDGLTQLVSLTELYLSDVLLEFLPASLGRLCKLRVLELRDNHLNSLPKAMHRLSQLRRLDLGCNDFSHVPPVLQQLTTLQELLMDGNSLLILPAMLGHLAALSYLDVSENRLCTVAAEIERCQDLQDLLLSSNQLPCLPASLGGLKKLKTLKVDGNKLTELPGTIGGLLLLEEFDCSYNELVTLPRTIGHLHHMHTLLADFNSLTHLPPEVGSCRAVRVVSLASNQLAWLPSEMSRLQRLRVLNLAHNRLRALPFSFMRLRSLSALWLSDNQSKPLVPLQNDVDSETGVRVLSNYMLPQPDTQTYDDEEEEDEEGEEPGEEGTLERALTDPVSGDGTERGSHRVAFLCDSSVDSVDVVEEPGNEDGARSPLCKVLKMKSDEEEEENDDDGDGDDEEDTFQDEDGYSEHDDDDEADEEEEDEEEDDGMEMRMAELLPPISDRPLVVPTLISLDSALESGVEDPSFGGQSDAGHADASTTTLPWLLGYDCLLVEEEEDGDNNSCGADPVLGPGGLAADGSSRVPETGDRTSGVSVDESPCVLNATGSPRVVSQSGPPSCPMAHSPQPVFADNSPSGIHDDSPPSGVHDDSPPSSILDNSPSSILDNRPPSSIRDDSPASAIYDDSSPSGNRDDRPPSSIHDNRPPSGNRDDSPPSAIHSYSPPSGVRDDSPPSIVKADDDSVNILGEEILRECSSQAPSGGGGNNDVDNDGDNNNNDVDNDEVAEATSPDRPPEPEGAARAGVLRGAAKAVVLQAGGAAVAALVVVVHSEPPRAVRVEPWQVRVIKRNADGRRGDTDKEQEDERQENIVGQGAGDGRTPTRADSGVTLPGPSQESSTPPREWATAREEWPSSPRGPSTPSHRGAPSPPLRRAPAPAERATEIATPVAGAVASVPEPDATPARRPGTAFALGRRESAMRRDAATTPPPLPPKRRNAQQDGSVAPRGTAHGQPHRLCCEHREHPQDLHQERHQEHHQDHHQERHQEHHQDHHQECHQEHHQDHHQERHQEHHQDRVPPFAQPGPPTWHADRRLHEADAACPARTECGLATRHALHVDTAGAAAAHAQIAPQYGSQEAHWHDGREHHHHDRYDRRDRQRVVHHPPRVPHRAGTAGQVRASRGDPCLGVGVPPAAATHQPLHTAERMQLAASRANYCDTVIAGACHGRRSPDGARANYAVPRPPAQPSAPWHAAPAAAAPPACPSHRPYGPPTAPCASPHLHRREEMRPEPVAEQPPDSVSPSPAPLPSLAPAPGCGGRLVNPAESESRPANISPPWPRHDWHRPDARQCPPHAQPQQQQPQQQQQQQPPGREAARAVPRQPSREQLIDFILQRITQPPAPAPPPLSQPQSHAALELGETGHAQELCVVLVKRPGLGFSIVGDAGTQPRSQTGILVHRVQPGGPAEEVLKPGDEILQANGIPLQGFTQAEAVALLKSLPSSVQLFVTRRVA